MKLTKIDNSIYVLKYIEIPDVVYTIRTSVLSATRDKVFDRVYTVGVQISPVFI